MVKISIISGFLGAGKSTFIKKLLKEYDFGYAPFLIENDYGSLGIDSVIMETTGIQVRELNSGCICCSLIGNFIIALEELIQKQKPEHIIIEPSGVGKLSEILEALNDLEVPFEKHLVLTIVDAKRFYYNNQYVSEYFWDQISNADAVILSKTQRLSGKELSDICSQIHHKNADQNVICVPWNQDYAPLLNSMLHSKSPLDLQEIKASQSADHTETHYTISPSIPMRSVHSANLKKVSSVTMKQPVYNNVYQKHSNVFESWSTETSIEYSEERLKEIIRSLEKNKTYGAIVRAKGILHNPHGSVLLDYVPGEGHLSFVDPDESGRLLIIGTNLNRPALERLFLT